MSLFSSSKSSIEFKPSYSSFSIKKVTLNNPKNSAVTIKLEVTFVSVVNSTPLTNHPLNT